VMRVVESHQIQALLLARGRVPLTLSTVVYIEVRDSKK
jgi:hypothetical protein